MVSCLTCCREGTVTVCRVEKIPAQNSHGYGDKCSHLGRHYTNSLTKTLSISNRLAQDYNRAIRWVYVFHNMIFLSLLLKASTNLSIKERLPTILFLIKNIGHICQYVCTAIVSSKIIMEDFNKIRFHFC